MTLNVNGKIALDYIAERCARQLFSGFFLFLHDVSTPRDFAEFLFRALPRLVGSEYAMLADRHALLRRSATAEPILDEIGARTRLGADRSKAGRFIVAKIEGAAFALCSAA